MLSLIALYQWTILASLAAGPALALLGAQLATRDRAMQTLCVGQGAMVGVLLGLGLFHDLEGTPLGTFIPFLSALVLSALTFLVTDWLVARRAAAKNTHFAFIFALLLAVGYLLSAVFPALESHMAQVYFGDLATLSVTHSRITVAASLICLGVLTLGASSISNQSFEWAVFGAPVSPRLETWGALGFKALTLVTLCFSVQFLGFLFTAAMLFLPTALMSFLPTKGLGLHFRLSALIASVSAVGGFILSLRFTRLPTVPSIVVAMFGLALCVLAAERVRLVFAKSSKAGASAPHLATEQA